MSLAPERVIEFRWRAEQARHWVQIVPASLLEILDHADELQSRLDKVRAVHKPSTRATSMHYHCDPHECDRAGEGEMATICDVCRDPYPCPTIQCLDGGDQ